MVFQILNLGEKKESSGVRSVPGERKLDRCTSLRHNVSHEPPLELSAAMCVHDYYHFNSSLRRAMLF